MRWIIHITITFTTLSGVLAMCARDVCACGTHGTNSGNHIGTYSMGDTDGDGLTNFFVSIQDDFIAPTTPTTCTAGIGLGDALVTLPSGLDVTDLRIVITDTATGASTPLAEFDFAPSTAASEGLATGSGSTTVLDTNPVFPGATWFGFAALVDPFTLPALGSGEVFEMRFELEVPPAALPLTLTTQFAGGEGQTDGTPLFTGDHPVTYFTVDNPEITLANSIPEPSTCVLAVLGLLSLGTTRRRRRR
jgi:hypothetical protein